MDFEKLIIICHRSNFNLDLFLVVNLAPFNVFVFCVFCCFFFKHFFKFPFLIQVIMISSKLIHVGWAIVVCHTKIPNCKFIRGQFQLKFIKTKHFTSCNVSKCPYGSLDIKRETNLFIFFNVFWNLCILSKTNLSVHM